MLQKICTLSILFLTLVCSSVVTAQSSIKLEVSVAEEVLTNFKPNGRVLLYLSKKDSREPRYQSGMDTESFVFGRNILNWPISKPLVLEGNSEWTKTGDWKFTNVPNGTYFVQAVWNQSGDVESRSNVPGNLYSEAVKVMLDGKAKTVQINLSKVIEDRQVTEHPLVGTFTMQSEILTKWWGKPVTLKASVLLPEGYEPNAAKRYAVRYNVAGYGGRYDRINRLVGNESFMDWWQSDQAPEIITVFLDGEGPFGDSYQLDSDNSGPYGEALIKELIPEIEQTYHINPSPETRFVDGCSTGGWVSLALQLYYPESFNGCWSYSPDPVSFEKMQLVNVYAGENAFYNKFGYIRPSKRSVVGEPEFSIKQEIYSENVQGTSNTYVTSGQQWGAWNALYSPKGTDGLPVPIFDPITGKVNEIAAENWKKYDLLLHAKNNWSELGPKVAGKVNIWMGDMDNYYLNNAMRDFDDYMKSTSNPASDASIEFSPTKGHCSNYSHREILEQIQKKLN
jgi:enterochelin esterase-like enzyme